MLCLIFATHKGSAATKVKKAVLINSIILSKYTNPVFEDKSGHTFICKKKLFVGAELITGN